MAKLPPKRKQVPPRLTPPTPAPRSRSARVVAPDSEEWPAYSAISKPKPKLKPKPTRKSTPIAKQQERERRQYIASLPEKDKSSPLFLRSGHADENPNTKIKGPVRDFLFDLFVQGYSWGEISKAIRQNFTDPANGDPLVVSPYTVKSHTERNLDHIKTVAEAQIGLALNKGLANKATRIAAYISHFRDLTEMIEQHRLTKKKKATLKWAVLIPLPQLLQERRKTLNDLRAEVEPVKVNIHADHTHRIAEEQARKAVLDVQGHLDELPDDVREVLGDALAKHSAGLLAEARRDPLSDGVPPESEDRPSDPGESAVDAVSPPDFDNPQ